jgi:hypothetical protein
MDGDGAEAPAPEERVLICSDMFWYNLGIIKDE